MVCSICKEAGHNRRNCAQRTSVAATPAKRVVKRMKKTKVESSLPSSSANDNILSVDYWKQTNTFQSLKEKETQIRYYTRMNSIEEVLQLVALESKPFGSVAESIIQEIFKLDPRSSSQNDGIRLGKKIEIKSARYWAGKDDCRWQHLEPEHDYNYILFVLLDFHGWNVWGITKEILFGDLLDKKIITKQGKQGYWTKKSKLLPYLTPIHCMADLDRQLNGDE